MHLLSRLFVLFALSRAMDPCDLLSYPDGNVIFTALNSRVSLAPARNFSALFRSRLPNRSWFELLQ